MRCGAGLGQVGALQPHAEAITGTLLATAQVASPVVADTATAVLNTLLSQLCSARLRLDAVPHSAIPGSPGAACPFFLFFLFPCEQSASPSDTLCKPCCFLIFS